MEGSAVAPLLVHLVTTRKDMEVLKPCVAAMASMAAFPEGRCELRISGCLRALEGCVKSSHPEVLLEGLQLLSNMAIDQVGFPLFLPNRLIYWCSGLRSVLWMHQFVREYIVSSDMVPYLVEFLSKECDKEEGQDDAAASLILSALINLAMMDSHVPDTLVLDELAVRLYRLACKEELKIASKAALILSHIACVNPEVVQDLASDP